MTESIKNIIFSPLIISIDYCREYAITIRRLESSLIYKNRFKKEIPNRRREEKQNYIIKRTKCSGIWNKDARRHCKSKYSQAPP